MNSLLAELLAASRQRPIEHMAAGGKPGRSLAAALCGRDRVSLLAEFKRCSPSAPSLAVQAELLPQLQQYAEAGAAGVSVLTEPTRFGGSLDDLRAAVATGALPILRKDFLAHPEQVQESAEAGASAVLLIVRCLPGGLLDEMIAACRTCGLEALVECHDQADLDRALPFADVMLGINNRDLDTLRIDRDCVLRLLPGIPDDRVVVAESGYDDPQQLRALVGRVDAVLIGTALMRGSAALAFANLGARA